MKKKMLENSERSVRGVRMGKSGPLELAELANQIQGFRIPDHLDASEKNKLVYTPASWDTTTAAKATAPINREARRSRCTPSHFPLAITITYD